MRLTLIPPAQPIFPRLMNITRQQRTLIKIRLYRINSKKSPLTAINPTFNSNPIMPVFLKINPLVIKTCLNVGNLPKLDC
jgi:hypothetical protein